MIHLVLLNNKLILATDHLHRGAKKKTKQSSPPLATSQTLSIQSIHYLFSSFSLPFVALGGGGVGGGLEGEASPTG